MDLDEPATQIQQAALWFAGWSPAERGMFFERLRERLVPTEAGIDDLAGLFGSVCATGPRQLSLYDQQLSCVCQWLDSWNDHGKNALMNALEEIDLGMVYAFLDQVKGMRWR